MKYTVEKELTDGDIEDILTTALEGGNGYWACLLNGDESWESSRRSIVASGQTPYYSTVMWHVLSSGETVRFQDAEDLEEGDIWELTMEKFKNGLVLYEKERGSIKKCLDDGAFDAIEADCLIQYAIFGEIIFG